MRILLGLFAFLLAACASLAPEAGDPNNLNIEIGRWGVMLSEVEQITTQTEPAAVADDRDVDPRQGFARDLRETAWRFNLQRSQLCAHGTLPAVTCGRAFAPVWLAEAPSAMPSYVEIARRSRALGAVVMPYWDAICADVRARMSDEEGRQALCPME